MSLRRVAVLVAGLVLVPLGLPLSAARGAAESTMFQVDAGHSGYVYGAGVVPPLSKAWSVTLNAPNYYTAIDAGRVFAFSESTTWPFPDSINAIDLSTGAITWSRQLSGVDAAAYIDLTVDGGVVFVAAGGQSPPSHAVIIVSAFDEATGAQLWSQVFTDQSFPSSLIAANGNLYFMGEGSGNTVYAVRERDGTLLWSTYLYDANPVTLAGGTLVVSDGDGLAYGLSAASGQVLWTHDEGSAGGNTDPSSSDGTYVWAEGDDQGRVFDPASGNLIERFHGYAPAFGYGEAVQAEVNSSNTLSIHAFDPGSLATRWTFTEPGGSTSPVGTVPLLADGYVFMEGSEGAVWALDPCSGQVVWQGATSQQAPDVGYHPLPGLAAGDGYLVVPTHDGLTAFKGTGTPPATAPNCASAATPPPSATGSSASPQSGGGSNPGTANGASPATGGSPSPGTGRRPAQHRRLRAKLTAVWRAGAVTSVARLVVTGVPRRTNLSFSCTGRGCPFKHRRFTVKAGLLNLTDLLRKAKLSPGAKLVLSLTKRGMVGEIASYRIRRNKPPALSVSCLTAAAIIPIACGSP